MTKPFPTLVPFGKYRNQPVDIMAADIQYVEWLMTQDWFTNGRYQNVYNTIINFGVADAKTPEHNKMQVRFLDNELVANMCTMFNYNWALNIEHCMASSYEGLKTGISKKRLVNDEPPYRPYYQDIPWWKLNDEEILEDEYNSLIVSSYEGITWELDTVFESYNWDVIVTGYGGHSFKGFVGGSRWVNYFIELKPTLGDDYASVLRQIDKRRMITHQKTGKCVPSILIYDEFNGTSATEKQVDEIFRRSEICCLSFSDMMTSIEKTKVDRENLKNSLKIEGGKS
jgi:hypothetical protein